MLLAGDEAGAKCSGDFGGDGFSKIRVRQAEDDVPQCISTILVQPEVFTNFDLVCPVSHLLSSEAAPEKPVENRDDISSLNADEFVL